LGFYPAVEQIDTAYLERYFGNATGSLYKAVQGAGTELAWYGESRDSYSGLIQKSDRADDNALFRMLDELNNGSNVEDVLDVSNVLKYIALNVVTANEDSYIGQNKHNYYLYERNGVFSILPWDYNMAFGGMGNIGLGFGGNRGGNMPGGAGAADGNGASANVPGGAVAADGNGAGGNAAGGGRRGGFEGGFGGFGGNTSVQSPAGSLERPLVNQLLAVNEYKEEYYGYVREALQGLLASETFNSRVDELAELIREHVQKDPRPFYSYNEFESGIESLKETNASNVSKYMQELDGGKQSSVVIAAAAQAAAPAESNGQNAVQPPQGGGGMPFPQNQGGGGMQLPQAQDGAFQFPQAPGGANANDGRGFPGWGGFPGNMQGASAGATEQQQTEAFLATLISLGLMALAAVFIMTYKRKRL